MSEYIKYKYDCSLHYFNKKYNEYKFFGQVKGNRLTEIKRKAREQGRRSNVSSRITISDLNTGKSFNINP